MTKAREWFLPGKLLVLTAVYAVVLCAGVLFLAVERPWLGLRLSFDAEANGAVVRSTAGPSVDIPVGTTIMAVADQTGNRVRLEALDFVPETDGALQTYEIYERFLQRQSVLTRIQSADEVTLQDTTGRAWQVRPAPTRPLSSLPADFWVQVAVGLIAWLISAGVWIFRRGEASARYLLLSGWSTAVFAPLAAIYSTRELGLPGELFRWLTDLNFLGGSLFAGALVAVLCCYPRRIGPRWLAPAAVLVQLGWFVAQELGAFESMILARRLLVMVALAATFGLAALQWRGTRRDPIGRAALRWFLLSWLVGSGLFVMLILLPQMFGFDTSAMQGYAFSLFILVYVGLAFGILRFGLFGLDEWWVRVVTWLGALLLLVLFDLLFLLGLNLSGAVSMSLSLLVCGLLWLPLRGFLLTRFLGRAPKGGLGAFKRIVDVVLALDPVDRETRWRHCLAECFDPMRMEPCADGADVPVVRRSGLELVMPAMDTMSALRMEYARGGRDLFNARDLTAARELVEMLRHAIDSRQAYERGVHVERGRIARDIHDNIGAQLLSALHSQEPDRRDDVLRGALADLRGIINDASNPALSVAESLGDLRYETAERLSAAGVELDWSVDTEAGGALPAKVMHVLRPLIREAINNVLKHAEAHLVQVNLRREDNGFVVMIEDDGKGFDPASVRLGKGLTGMDERVSSLQGALERSAASEGGGARLTIRLPIPSNV